MDQIQEQIGPLGLLPKYRWASDYKQHLCRSLKRIPMKKGALNPPSQRTQNMKKRKNLWTGVIPHLLSLPVPAGVSCSTEREQPVALSRFMSQIIIGNIRQLLRHKGRLERKGSRWRERTRWRWFENMRGEKRERWYRVRGKTTAMMKERWTKIEGFG